MSAYRQGLTGEGVKVGFVDSGINTAHVDLDDARIDGANFHADGFPSTRTSTATAPLPPASWPPRPTTAWVWPASRPGPISGPTGYSPKDHHHGRGGVGHLRQAIGDGCDVINLSLGTQYQSNTLRPP